MKNLKIQLVLLFGVALTTAVGSSHPVTLIGGPDHKPCAAGSKHCCHYNHSIFHSHLKSPAGGGPAPFRLDQHYTLNVANDTVFTVSSTNGTFAETAITVGLPVDYCDRVSCSACAACGHPCGPAGADQACAEACPSACVEKIWGQDLIATFSTDPSGRSNASKPVTLKGHVNDNDCGFITWEEPDDPIPPTAGPYGGRLVWLEGPGEQECCATVTADCPIRCPKCCDSKPDTCNQTWRCPPPSPQQ
jgi:hypothetical protein